jgi:hypothetical protein
MNMSHTYPDMHQPQRQRMSAPQNQTLRVRLLSGLSERSKHP